MDRIRISRKRKTSYSSRPHPLSGTLTRSKSQIFLHRNRSGHLHSDSRRRQQPYARSRRPRPRPAGCVSDTRHGSSENDDNNDYDDDVMVFIKDLRKKRKVKPKGEDSNCDGEDVSRVLIKDIRLRRVYSTQSSVEKDNSGDLKVKGESDEDFNVNVDDVTNTRIEESLINDSVLKSKSVLRPCVKEKLSKIPGAVSNKRLFPFLMDIMGDDFGTSKSGYCQKNEKGVNGGQDFQLSLSCRSQEGTKCELKDDKCTVLDTCHSGASEGDTLIGHVDELSHGNWSKLQSREVTSECLSVSSLNDICLSESKAGPTADFHGVRDVENSMHNDDFKQGSNHKRNLDRAKAANHGGYTSEQFGVLNEGCILTIPPDAVICNNPEVNLSQLESMPHDVHHVKPMGLARSTTENSGEVFYVTADKKKDPVRKSKSVPGPNLNRKFFKTPGSISYRRMLPFLKDLTKDDSVISEFCHPTLHKNDEVHMYAKKFEVPLSSQGCKASIEEHKTESGHMHGTVKCNALVNNVLVDPANELSHGNQLQLTPSPGILETPMQLDAKVVNGLSAPSPSEHIEKVEIGSKDVCLSDSKFDLCSLMVESECVKNVVNTEHNDGFEQVQNKIYRQHNSESTTPEAQNLLYINDVSSLAFENCSSKEKGLTIDCDEKKQFKGMEKREYFIKNPPESQGLNHLGPNMLDVEKEACRKIIYEKSDMTKHASVKAENDLNGIVYGPSLPSKSESTTPEAQNLLYINDVSSLAFENCSSKEKGLTIDCDEKKQFKGMEKREYFIKNPPESQGLNHLGPNMLDVEKEACRKIIYEKLDMTKHASVKAENDLNGIVYGPSLPSKRSKNGSGSCVRENRNGSESKALLAINSCSRETLLKHAGSFSYKRMLPFILNSMKDNPCVSVTDHYPKLRKCLDQTPLAVSASDLQVIPISGSDDCRGNSSSQQETGLHLHAHSLNNDSSSPISQIPEPQSSHDSCKVIQLKDEQVVLNGSCNLESSPDPSISVHKIDSPITPVGATVNEVITREEETMCPIPLSSIYPAVKGNTSVFISYNGEKPPEAHQHCRSLSQHKVLDQIRVPAAGFKKGILKRNPRGCRGLCTCLDCVSFRLHAERSFEFSRNQFLDAEEVAQDLIKELSDLRNMLERSSVSIDGNPVVCANHVEEACQKAFATEQLAKDRLSQMNDDLNIHCRVRNLQRPRVKFTDHVEEKVIQPFT